MTNENLAILSTILNIMLLLGRFSLTETLWIAEGASIFLLHGLDTCWRFPRQSRIMEKATDQWIPWIDLAFMTKQLSLTVWFQEKKYQGVSAQCLLLLNAWLVISPAEWTAWWVNGRLGHLAPNPVPINADGKQTRSRSLLALAGEGEWQIQYLDWKFCYWIRICDILVMHVDKLRWYLCSSSGH